MIRSLRSLQLLTAAATIGAVVPLSGCTTAEIYNQGYVADEQTLALVPVGSSRDQVLLALGSPSTTATFNSEVFYYISQKRIRPVAFMNPQLVDQKVLAIYFGPDGRVANIANYGLQNGRVFDFVSRTTPTGGQDASFLGQIFSDSTGALPTQSPVPGR